MSWRIEPDPEWEELAALRLARAGWTCHPPGASCIGSNHSYQGKHDTSYGASVYVKPRTGTLRERVLTHLQTIGPATDVDIQRQLGMVPNTERPRRVELVEGGFVRDSGLRKKHHGEEHIIWEAVPVVYQGEAT